jgi:hypothetical protein
MNIRIDSSPAGRTTYYDWEINIDNKCYNGVNTELEAAFESIMGTLRDHEVRLQRRFQRTEY